MNIIPIKDVDKRVVDNISTARISLQTKPDYAFFVAAMLNFELSYTEDVEVAATDGLNLFINPKPFSELSNKQIAFVFMHETMHIILDHITRLVNKDHNIWNTACDYIINNMLDDLGMEMPPYGYIDHKYDGLSADEVYVRLVEEVKAGNNTPSPTFNDMLPQSGDGGAQGNTTSNGSPMKSGTPDQIRQQVQDIVDQSIIHASQQGEKSFGNIPAFLMREHLERITPVIDWKKQLAQFMFSTGNKGTSFKKPSKHGLPLGLIMPGKMGKGLGRIDFAIDTSGSISQEMFNKFVSEIAFVFEKMKPKNIGIMQFDHELKANNLIKRPSEFKNIKFSGGGGTCVEPVMQQYMENPSKALMVLTDGYFSKNLTNPNKPVIWVVYDNDKWVPPFGRVVHFKIKDLLKRKQ